MLRHPPILCVLLAIAGCQGAPDPSPIRGIVKTTFISESGDHVVAFGPDELEIAALVPRGGGDWHLIAGQIDGDGRFVTEPAPEGAYLRVKPPGDDFWPYFVAVGARTIDMNSVSLGRAESVIPGQPTPLTIEGLGLEPWALGNELHFFSLGAGAFDDDLERLSGLRLPETAQRISLTVDTASFRQPRLVDADEGDQVFITELARQRQNGVGYLTPVSVFRADPLVQVEGEPETVLGTFEPIAASTNQRVNWKLGGFAKIEKAVSPMATTKIHTLFFIADPAGPNRMSGGYPPEILYSGIDATRTLPVTFPFTAEYRNPYPREWALKFVAYTQFEVPGLPQWLWPTVGGHGPLDEHVELQIALLLSPPQDLQVGGKDASGALAGTGLTPALHWKAPATGKATLYDAAVYQQDEAGEFQLAGVVVTDRGDIAIPPGVLRSGSPYVVLVTAYSDRAPGTPDQVHSTGSHATAVTGLLTP
jgi:hypothetical protein